MEDIILNNSVVLVTGGAGFIGSHLADRLLLSGSKVIVADDLSTGREENINPNSIFYKVDITDENSLKKIFEKHNIDYVIHQAAKINLNVMLEEPLKDVQNSIMGTLNLLKCCVDFEVKKIIYASSVAVYGRAKRLPAEEMDELVPIYSYGIAKKCTEEYVRYYSDYYGLNYSILRYANVYGPRQPIYGEVGVIAIYTDRVVKGEPLIIYGDGSYQRDCIYIDDVVNVTLRTVSAGDKETFNVGCGVGMSVMEIFEHFCSVSGKTLRYEYKPERIGELGLFYCDISKLCNLIHYSPKVSIREGIYKTLSYYGAGVESCFR